MKIGALAERVIDGLRVLIFSGGATDTDEALIEEIRGTRWTLRSAVAWRACLPL